MSFHIASGATVIAGGVVTLSLSDQADTCATLINAKRGNPPVGTWTVLSLNAAPGVDGSTTAQVIATNTPTPSPGKVAGALRRSEGNTQLASLNAADGTVSWTLDATNDSTITLDVGFAGTPDRINTYGIFLNQCQP
jgi:hypothetical protein